MWPVPTGVPSLIVAVNAKFFDFDMPDEVTMTVQDRAYTSPVWYTP
jgi:hypothetical protein